MSNECLITGVRRGKDNRLDFLIQMPNKEPSWVSESSLPNDAIDSFLSNLKARVDELSKKMNQKGFHAKKSNIAVDLKPLKKKLSSHENVQMKRGKAEEKVKSPMKESGIRLSYKAPSFKKTSVDYASGDESGMETERTCGNDTEPEDFMQFVAKLKKTKKVNRFSRMRGKRMVLDCVEIPVYKSNKKPIIIPIEENVSQDEQNAYTALDMDHALSSCFDVGTPRPVEKESKIELSDIFEMESAGASSADEKKEISDEKVSSSSSEERIPQSDSIDSKVIAIPSSPFDGTKRLAKRSNIIFFD